METNRTYRRHVSTARLGLSSHCAVAQSLLNALSDCKGNIFSYRVHSLQDCLCQYFPKYFFGSYHFTFLNVGNIADLFALNSYYQSNMLDLISRIKICNISAIEFYSNGDIKLHFFPYKYKCS